MANWDYKWMTVGYKNPNPEIEHKILLLVTSMANCILSKTKLFGMLVVKTLLGQN